VFVTGSGRCGYDRPLAPPIEWRRVIPLVFKSFLKNGKIWKKLEQAVDVCGYDRPLAPQRIEWRRGRLPWWFPPVFENSVEGGKSNLSDSVSFWKI
jgi:hypothetical protein